MKIQIYPREAKILMLRHGLYENKYHTLQAIATLLKITRERVRQIDLKAQRKLYLLSLLKKPSRIEKFFIENGRFPKE